VFRTTVAVASQRICAVWQCYCFQGTVSTSWHIVGRQDLRHTVRATSRPENLKALARSKEINKEWPKYITKGSKSPQFVWKVVW
jgi:hypothetical protein